MKRALGLALVAACSSTPPHGRDDHAGSATSSASSDAAIAPDARARVTLAPAPPAPAVPLGLPSADATAPLSPEAIAFGELLFFDPRLSASGHTSCATCHDPDHGWADLRPRAATDAGQPNLRRTPAIANLRWARSFAWDGRYDTLEALLDAHVKGQLGLTAPEAIVKIVNLETYVAHVARQPDAVSADQAAIAALAAYVRSRYQGAAPWDRYERGAKTAVGPDAVRGYALFTGKAQCSVCHVPPLYRDGRFHAIGLVAQADLGRGKVDPAARGAFETPTLRGAALHAPYFHDGSAATLDDAVDWHLRGGTGQGADRSIIDPALAPITLGADERAALIAFVRALSPSPGAPAPRPELPQ